MKAQFLVRDGYIVMNAANLCPAPRSRRRRRGCRHARRGRRRLVPEPREVRTALDRDADAAGKYMGAAEDEVAIVRNTSEANNIVVGGVPLKAGDDVLLFDENHPDQQRRVGRPRRALRIHGPAGEGRRRRQPTPARSSTRSGSALLPNTRVLSITDVSSNTGVRLPSAELCALARERGIWAHVDGAQTLGALRRDMHALGCDSTRPARTSGSWGRRRPACCSCGRSAVPSCGREWLAWGGEAPPTTQRAGGAQVRDVRPAE